MFRSGMTLQSIGSELCLTRERVRQLLVLAGIDASEGGVSMRTRENRRAYDEKLEASSRARYGCSRNEVRAIVDEARSDVRLKYRHQLLFAARRKIEWHLTLSTWWKFWKKSGAWSRRGYTEKKASRRGRLCMCRFGDKGPYAIGNIFIGDCIENLHAGIKKKFPYSF